MERVLLNALLIGIALLFLSCNNGYPGEIE